jgi:hypothetical protein
MNWGIRFGDSKPSKQGSFRSGVVSSTKGGGGGSGGGSGGRTDGNLTMDTLVSVPGFGGDASMLPADDRVVDSDENDGEGSGIVPAPSDDTGTKGAEEDTITPLANACCAVISFVNSLRNASRSSLDVNTNCTRRSVVVSRKNKPLPPTSRGISSLSRANRNRLWTWKPRAYDADSVSLPYISASLNSQNKYRLEPPDLSKQNFKLMRSER